MTLVRADLTGTSLRLGVSAGGQTGTLPGREHDSRQASTHVAGGVTQKPLPRSTYVGAPRGRAAAILESDCRPLRAPKRGSGELGTQGSLGAPTHPFKTPLSSPVTRVGARPEVCGTCNCFARENVSSKEAT